MRRRSPSATLALCLLAAGCLATEQDPNRAVYDHWAYLPPRSAVPPPVQDPSWIKSPIDAFVLARLEAEGLTPAPPVDRAHYLRRLSLDLSGLPPSPEEVSAFEADASSGAEEAAIERLLSSPRTAENWTRDWLDIARYADSNGYQVDLEREMWPWRDWVISAFQKDLRLDRFIRLQLAGDLLDDPDGTLASAFNRNHAVTTEGGVVEEEYRSIYAADRVNTIGAAFLGLTVGCARCHDHKYDPLTTLDYYRLTACFNQIDDAGKANDNHFRPTLSTAGPLVEAERARLAQALSAVATDLDLRIDADRHARQDELAALGPVRWIQPERPMRVETESGLPLRPQDDGSFLAEITETERTVLRGVVPLANLRAIRLELLRDTAFPQGGPGGAQDGRPWLSEFDAWVDGPEGRQKLEILWADASEAPGDAAKAIDGSGSSAWAPPAVNAEIRFGLAESMDTRNATITVRLTQLEGAEHVIGRFRLSFSEHPLAAILPDAAPATRRLHHGLFLAPNPLQTEVRDREALVRAQASLSAAVSTMVMKTSAKPQPTYVFVRGDYQHHGDSVGCEIPRWILPGPKGRALDRRDVADWLLSPDHPLTARVIVNRVWQRYFGVGLVRTLDNFGRAGERPSHPELLDWLARELIDSGWDLRHVHRLILRSATYRQSSATSRERLARDPDNRLLGRGARFRLPAEVIRDTALWAGGILDERLGGPSVFPPQPPGLWEELNDRKDLFTPYRTDSGARAHRRSLYLFWKRSLPPPSMSTFDAPTRESPTVQRAVTNTPLQALALMNSPESLEAAEGLALRMVAAAPGEPSDWIRYGFRMLTSRTPTAEELEILAQTYQDQRAAFQAEPDAIARLDQIGDASRLSPLDPPSRAALTQVARVLLNLSETITRE